MLGIIGGVTLLIAPLAFALDRRLPPIMWAVVVALGVALEVGQMGLV